MSYAEIWKTLRAIDVTPMVQKRRDLDYLPWADVHAIMMEHYPDYQADYPEPTVYRDGSVEVVCTVTIGEVSRTELLPVMDNRHNAIKGPDARAMNDARQRCYVKCIARFGLGLTLYQRMLEPEIALTTALDEPITAEQAASIKAEMEELGADVKAFCKHIDVPSIDAIRKPQMTTVERLLAAKRRSVEGS